jgi:TRAP transporter TAXI family solute receptor
MYGYAVGGAEILNRYTNLEVTVESTGGTNTALKGLIAGVMNLVGPNDITGTIRAYGGTVTWEQPNKQLRIIVAAGGLYRGYLTKMDSGIKTIPDLKGKKIFKEMRTPENVLFYEAIYDVYGLKYPDDFVEVEAGTDTEALEHLIMGRVDAMLSTVSTRMLLPLEEAIGQISFIPIEKEKIIEAREKYPELMVGRHPGVVTPGYLKGMKLDSPVPMAVAPRFFTTTKELPDEVAYTIAKTLVDYAEEFQTSVPDFSRDTAVFTPEVPYHPGAIKAYKELGLWNDDLEKAQQALLAAE